MADRHLQERMENILSRLSIPINLIDRDIDTQAVAREPGLANLAEGTPTRLGSRIYVAIPRSRVVLSVAADQPAALDVLTLASELIATMTASGDNHTENSFDVYRRALRGELAGSELEALSHEHQLPADLRRCVLVFHIVQTDNERA